MQKEDRLRRNLSLRGLDNKYFKNELGRNNEIRTFQVLQQVSYSFSLVLQEQRLVLLRPAALDWMGVSSELRFGGNEHHTARFAAAGYISHP